MNLRDDDWVRHPSPALLRQRIYQIVAGYEDANDADRLRHDPTLQIVADQKLGEALGSQPTLSRWENAPSARDLLRLNDTLLARLRPEQLRRIERGLKRGPEALGYTTGLWTSARVAHVIERVRSSLPSGT